MTAMMPLISGHPEFSGEILQESNLGGAGMRRSLEEMVP
jgi:hypothetical protein